MDEINEKLAIQILMTDPETGEELRPICSPKCIDDSYVIIVSNKDKTRKWKHQIFTEEL